MFSSSNINPFPQIPSSSSSFHAPFTDAEAAAAAGFFPFHHQHDPLLAGYYFPAAAAGANYNTAPQVFHNLGVLGHDLGGVMTYKNIKKDNQENGGGSELGNRKGAPRKDRHSKISTSQGLRDRRVRLSIGISREFFDLQDMLGFDTASKTLEWLLGKSRKDIQELEEKIKNKNIKNASSSSNNNSDGEQESNEEEEGHVPSEKKVKKSQKEAVARECRAKARERARERTREKLCTTCSTKSCPHHHHHYHNHQSNPNYHGLTQLGSHNHNMAPFLGVHDKPSSSNSQQLREENVEIIQRNKLMVNPAESSKGFVDWDISNAIRPSSICSATNLSTELQMYGKP